MAKPKFDITKNFLVPKHIKLNDKDTKQLLKKHNISAEELPKIVAKDPAIQALDAQPGDIIKIERSSPTSGDIEYYRCVIDG